MPKPCATKGTSPVVRNAIALAIAVAAVLAAPAARGQESLTSAAARLSWSATGAEALRALLKDNATVKRFLNEIDTGDPTGAGAIEAVKEYRLLDLWGDGQIELIALIDVSGRGFFNILEIVRLGPEGFVTPEVRGFQIEGLESTLKDLDGDGRYELVVPTLLEEYEGARPLATLEEVYVFNGQQYVKASGRFPQFYSEVVLPRLQRELAKLEATPETEMAAEERVLWRKKYQTEIAEATARISGK